MTLISEYIFIDENVLFDEKCSASGDADKMCEEGLQFYDFIFTCSVIASACGAVFVGMAEVKIGLFWNRLLCNSLTTGGLVCLAFYRQNGYLVMAGWVLISFPSVYYIVSNIWLASLFPAISGLIVVLVSAVFDMSGGMFGRLVQTIAIF